MHLRTVLAECCGNQESPSSPNFRYQRAHGCAAIAEVDAQPAFPAALRRELGFFSSDDMRQVEKRMEMQRESANREKCIQERVAAVRQEAHVVAQKRAIRTQRQAQIRANALGMVEEQRLYREYQLLCRWR